jgi:hypothetical protein
MLDPLTIPFAAKMLFNVVKLKPEYSLEVDYDLLWQGEPKRMVSPAQAA